MRSTEGAPPRSARSVDHWNAEHLAQAYHEPDRADAVCLGPVRCAGAAECQHP